MAKLNEIRVVEDRTYRAAEMVPRNERVPGPPKAGHGACTGCEVGDDCAAVGECSGVIFKRAVTPLPVTPLPVTPLPVPSAPAGGTKNDSGKPRMELLDSLWLTGVARVLTFGATKYAPHNWRAGLQLSRLLGACLRHIFAFLRGEDKDPETGESHLYHASCCLMFAANMVETRPDMDDRYKAPQ